ncbi:MAG: signal peptidase II [Spirochaetaceae bacterium]|jgi:signal peptidase II|nr:signal peptidase II [Spirochaetaceae bacterium]
MKRSATKKTLPFLLTAFIILADQGVKSFIVQHWPDTGRGVFIKDVFNNDFLWIYHVRNRAIAFSLGHTLPEFIKPALFIIVPLILLGGLVWYYFKSGEITGLQRWVLAGIIGGGLGNLIDRIFRPAGVVDFISVKFYGIFGLARWPTFNIADASVVVSCIILLISILVTKNPKEENRG